MNLTKSLKWAMSCAAITALSASATDWVIDDFYFNSSGYAGRPILHYTDDWSATGEDASKIAASDLAFEAFCDCDKPLGQTTDNLVLELNTEGATLIRTIDGGAPFSAVNPVYVDMMVKFVLSEEEPNPPAGAQALIYANSDSNLVVYSSEDGGSNVAFSELEGAVIDPEQWYRLTLTWTVWGDFDLSIFSVQLNGIGPFTSAAGFTLLGFDQGGCWHVAAADSSITTLSSIEFQGTGFIDELVVTDAVPDFGNLSGDPNFANDSNLPTVNATNYQTWQNANATSISNAGGVQSWMYNAYLLNVDPGTAEAKLVITSIEPIIGTGAEITLAAVNGLGVTVPFANPYGTLTISKTAALGSAFVPVTDYTVTAGVYSISGIGTEYFFKAEVK